MISEINSPSGIILKSIERVIKIKTLFVGDVHNHTYIFDDIERLDKEYNFDRIIFLGDYIDDWNTTNDESSKTLLKVIQLKESNPNKYIFCLGNHELSYLGYPCSGHQYDGDNIIENLLKDDINLFDLYYSINLGDKHYYCTHAGITNSYIHGVLNRINEEDFYLYKTNSHIKNLDVINKDKLNSLHLLNKVSSLRGGRDNYSSMVWCDKREHEYFSMTEEYLIPYQIIGHTPVTTVSNISGNNLDLYFIDTHSTYRDGRNIGDKSYLVWDEDKFTIVY